MISELALDCAFAKKLSSSPEFCMWVLNQTKFKDRTKQATLLHRGQAEAKPRKKRENWWRHWWCRLDDGSESETDILAIFGIGESDLRIALHIEDKPPHGKFTVNQYQNYKRRAEFMSGKAEFMNYSEFTTILLAPKRFFDEHFEEAQHFECFISYESVAQIIPLFGESLADPDGHPKYPTCGQVKIPHLEIQMTR